MKITFAAAAMAALLMAASADAKPQVKPAKGVARAGMLILYSEPNFNGDTYAFVKTRIQVPMEWNIRSVAVAQGESWEVCEKARFKAPCMTLDQSYANSGDVGITGMIGSLRPTAAKTK